MHAKQFNQCYAVGSLMVYRPTNSVIGYGDVVRTVDKARDFKCGSIVEIDREPYFVKVETLTPAA